MSAADAEDEEDEEEDALGSWLEDALIYMTDFASESDSGRWLSRSGSAFCRASGHVKVSAHRPV
jgi:hypothetical protein